MCMYYLADITIVTDNEKDGRGQRNFFALCRYFFVGKRRNVQ